MLVFKIRTEDLLINTYLASLRNMIDYTFLYIYNKTTHCALQSRHNPLQIVVQHNLIRSNKDIKNFDVTVQTILIKSGGV
jgi:hypothetical protein